MTHKEPSLQANHHRWQERRLKLSVNNPSDQHDVDPLPGPGRDAVCTMEHRAPSGKGRSRGRGNERSNTRSTRHTLGAGSRSSRHTTLVVEMLRGGGERRPPNTETRLHAPGVDSRLQIRLPPSCQRHQNTEGGGRNHHSPEPTALCRE
jgi:hypothetical protein